MRQIVCLANFLQTPLVTDGLVDRVAHLSHEVLRVRLGLETTRGSGICDHDRHNIRHLLVHHLLLALVLGLHWGRRLIP